PRAGRAGARGRTLVAGPADPAAHAGPPGAGRTALPRRGHARQPSLSPRLTPPGVEPGGVRAGSAAVEPEIDRHDAHRLHRLAAAHRRLEAPAALHVARGLAVEHRMAAAALDRDLQRPAVDVDQDPQQHRALVVAL